MLLLLSSLPLLPSLPPLLAFELPPYSPSFFQEPELPERLGPQDKFRHLWKSYSSLGPLPPSLLHVFEAGFGVPEKGVEWVRFIKNFKEILEKSFPSGRPPLSLPEREFLASLLEGKISEFEKKISEKEPLSYAVEFPISFFKKSVRNRCAELTAFSSLEILLSLMLRFPKSFEEEGLGGVMGGKKGKREDIVVEIMKIEKAVRNSPPSTRSLVPALPSSSLFRVPKKFPSPLRSLPSPLSLLKCQSKKVGNLEGKKEEMVEKAFNRFGSVLLEHKEGKYFFIVDYVGKIFAYNFGNSDDYAKSRKLFNFRENDGILEFLDRFIGFLDLFGASGGLHDMFVGREEEGGILRFFRNLFMFLRRRFHEFKLSKNTPFPRSPTSSSSSPLLFPSGNEEELPSFSQFSEFSFLIFKGVVQNSRIGKPKEELEALTFLLEVLDYEGEEEEDLPEPRLALLSSFLILSLFPSLHDEDSLLSSFFPSPPSLPLLPSLGRWLTFSLPRCVREMERLLEKEKENLERKGEFLMKEEGETEDEGRKEGRKEVDESWDIQHLL